MRTGVQPHVQRHLLAAEPLQAPDQLGQQAQRRGEQVSALAPVVESDEQTDEPQSDEASGEARADEPADATD